MNAKTVELEALTKAVRACFQRLKAFGERLHGDLRVTVAMRAVLETLTDDGPLTVPQIVRNKGVTRQHIQAIVDSLLENGLVELSNNPTHQRSSLVAMTKRADRLFAEMRRREARALTAVGRSLRQADIGAALLGLTEVNAVLENHLKEMHHES